MSAEGHFKIEVQLNKKWTEKLFNLHDLESGSCDPLINTVENALKFGIDEKLNDIETESM